MPAASNEISAIRNCAGGVVVFNGRPVPGASLGGARSPSPEEKRRSRRIHLRDSIWTCPRSIVSGSERQACALSRWSFGFLALPDGAHPPALDRPSVVLPGGATTVSATPSRPWE